MSLYSLEVDDWAVRYASPPCSQQCDAHHPVTEVTTVLHERNGIRFANSANHWSDFYPWANIAILHTEGHERHVDR